MSPFSLWGEWVLLVCQQDQEVLHRRTWPAVLIPDPGELGHGSRAGPGSAQAVVHDLALGQRRKLTKVIGGYCRRLRSLRLLIVQPQETLDLPGGR